MSTPAITRIYTGRAVGTRMDTIPRDDDTIETEPCIPFLEPEEVDEEPDVYVLAHPRLVPRAPAPIARGTRPQPVPAGYLDFLDEVATLKRI
jgi:hypothetical protein